MKQNNMRQNGLTVLARNHLLDEHDTVDPGSTGRVQHCLDILIQRVQIMFDFFP